MPYNRLVRLKLENNLFYNSVLYISGPRGSGKKGLCEQAKIDFSYLDLRNKKLSKIASKFPSQFIKGLPSGIKILEGAHFCHEIYKSIRRVVHRIALRHLYDVPPQFIILDNAHPLLETYIHPTAINAAYILELLPPSAAEVIAGSNLEFLNNVIEGEFDTKRKYQKNNLSEGAMKGTFPEIIDLEFGDRIDFFKNHLSYIFQDLVLKRFNLERGKLYRKFYKFLSSKMGKKLDWLEIADFLSISQDDAKNDLMNLRYLYLIHIIEPFEEEKKIDNSIIYFIDSCLLMYVMGRKQITIQDYPILLENFVVSELLKQLEFLEDYRLYHLKHHQDYDIDFVIENIESKKLIPIKLCFSGNKEELDFSPFHKFKSHYAENFQRGIMIYLGNRIISDKENNDYYGLPISAMWDFVKRENEKCII